jgi:hypothetical protein
MNAENARRYRVITQLKKRNHPCCRCERGLWFLIEVAAAGSEESRFVFRCKMRAQYRARDL